MSQESYGWLTVLEWDFQSDLHEYHGTHGRVMCRKLKKALCVCRCGTQVVVQQSNLKNGNTKSCGCLQRQRASETHRLHGMSLTPLYQVWLDMRNRCYNTNIDRYKSYGGRGIRVCDEWKNSSKAFLKWAVDYGYQPGLCIDRIDVDGNYEPSNCRWTTRAEMQANTTRSKLYTAFGETKHKAAWMRDSRCEVAPITLHRRLKRGVSMERALQKEAMVYG